MHHTFGSELFNKKKYDEAEIEFSAAIQYNPKVAYFFLHRGNALYFQQKYEECYRDYEKALELNPDLSEACERLNQFRKAERRKQAKEQNSTDRLSLPRLEKSMSATLITEQTSRPVVPRNIRVARKREIQANKDLYNLWDFPDTSHLLKDPLLVLMANGGKGPTKLRKEHQYKGDRKSRSNNKMTKSFSATNIHSNGK